jgi:hypothetical protein
MANATVTPASAEVGFIPDVYSAEDLAALPGSNWVIASGMAGPDNQGHLYAIDADAKTATVIFPTGGEGDFKLDASTYGEVDRPDLNDFSAVGVSLREGGSGVHTLYAVNHGGRAAIEVFEIDATASTPSATWVGMIPLQKGVWGNAVAALADGGIVATNFMSTEDPEAVNKVLAGEVTGNIQEWHAGQGWTDLPGTECCSPNGLEISRDERWLYVCSWSPRKVLKISRGQSEVERSEIDVPLMPDNIKWGPSGRLFVTGQTEDAKTVFAGISAGATHDAGLKVLGIDGDTLDWEELLTFAEPGGFGTASTALEAGNTIWIGSARADRVAYFQHR